MLDWHFMNRFWLTIGLVLLAAILVVFAVAPTSYDYPPRIVRQTAKFVVASSLVAVVWAILFRKQVEKLRVSLFSLFVLVTLEGFMLGLAILLDPT